MSETNPYAAPEGHVPNPTDVYGTWDTSGTGGTSRIEDVTPVFDVAKVQDAKVALKALDPEDDTPRSLVTLPEATGQGDNDVARERLEALAATESVTTPAGSEIPVGAPVATAPDGSNPTADVTDGDGGSVPVPQNPTGENDGDGTDAEAGDHGDFDPAAHSVKEVKAYLETADDAEKQRVLAAEAAGHDRPTLRQA